MEIKQILIIVTSTLLISIGIVYFSYQSDIKCDEHIILNDGEEYDCRSVSSWSNGMSTINMCDGERIDIPTNRIKQITKIKTND
jgi:hypothetical protein